MRLKPFDVSLKAIPPVFRLAPRVGPIALTLCLAASLNGQEPDYGAVRRYVDEHQHAIVDELLTLLAIPNVAADSVSIRRNAVLLQEMLRRRGIAARALETGGSPLVFGELRVPGAARTVLFYCHYDGQPVDPSRWVGHRPFDPVLRAGPLETSPAILPRSDPGTPYDPDWRLYARSASDDKSPIVALLAAVDALGDQGRLPTANLKFLFEGEEEAGSPNLEHALRKYASLLRADVAVFVDGPVHPSGSPTVGFGVRGIVSVSLTVYGPMRPLHSGHYGNWAPNPAQRLASLLASMKDETGRVRIPGWYDDVVPLSDTELRALRRLPDDPAEMRALGVPVPEGEGRSRWEMVTLPSLNVDGIRSAWVGADARTIIPDRAEASLDFRLVRDVKPADQVARFIAYVESRGYHVVRSEPDAATRLRFPLLARISTPEGRGYPAVRTPLDHPAARSLIRELETATGGDLVVIPTYGGSLPGFLFPELLGAAFVTLPIVNPDNNQHSPNENLRLGNLFDGIVSLAAAMEAHW
ncbi:MAG: M20/M25/M40 family metallo-hydrolase [Gemmatimonadota bacterium]